MKYNWKRRPVKWISYLGNLMNILLDFSKFISSEKSLKWIIRYTWTSWIIHIPTFEIVNQILLYAKI